MERMYRIHWLFVFGLMMVLGLPAIACELYPTSIEFKSGEDNYLISFDSDHMELVRDNNKIFRYSTRKYDKQSMESKNELTDFQKESIGLVKTFSLRLILIAVGVFSLTGIYMLKSPRRFIWIGVPIIIIFSYFLFIISIYYGFMVFGNIIWQLSKESFDAFDEVLVKDGRTQFHYFFIAGVMFIGAIFLNFIIELISRCCTKKGKK